VICKKIHSAPGVVRLGEISDFTVSRGEINQTIYRKYIKIKSDMDSLLKGVEVGRYHLNEKLSQGYREWFDEKTFLNENSEKPVVKCRRIATQRITGVDERLRIVATIVEPKTYFADSTNSITIILNSKYCLKYLLGLLNSTLFQWRFKLTSTNNNIGTNELNSMPFRQIDFSYPTEKAQHDRLVNLVNQMLVLNKKLAEAKTPQTRDILERQIKATDKQNDHLVYKLYDLTEEEIEIVESKT
jgi:adenine-specific DNA-methyltransferase